MIDPAFVDKFEQAMDDHTNTISTCELSRHLCQYAVDQARSTSVVLDPETLLAAHRARGLGLGEAIATLKILHAHKGFYHPEWKVKGLLRWCG